MLLVLILFLVSVLDINNFAIQWTANPTTKPTRPYTWTYPIAFSTMVVGFSWMHINKNNLDYPAELQAIPTLTQCTWYSDRSGNIQSTGYYMIVFGF